MITRLVHCNEEPYDQMIDRTTKWGNPYKKGHKLTRDEAEYLGAVHRENGSITRSESIRLYERYLRNNAPLLADIESLRGLTIACWCKRKSNPQRCHGEIILKILNEMEQEKLFEY
jgi:hypothetical protein